LKRVELNASLLRSLHSLRCPFCLAKQAWGKKAKERDREAHQFGELMSRERPKPTERGGVGRQIAKQSFLYGAPASPQEKVQLLNIKNLWLEFDTTFIELSKGFDYVDLIVKPV